MDVNSHYCATVQTPGLAEIRILGHKYINRAIHGDLVVIELLTDVKEKETQVFCTDTAQMECQIEIIEGLFFIKKRVTVVFVL
jgi:hypothetical protein